jgi:hypothetical protein
MAAAGQMRRDASDSALKAGVARGSGNHVLVETQLAAGAHDAPQLGQRARLTRNGAQHERGDGRVEAGVRKRELVGERVHQADRAAGTFGGLLGLAAQVVLGLDRHDLVDRRRIQPEVLTSVALRAGLRPIC